MKSVLCSLLCLLSFCHALAGEAAKEVVTVGAEDDWAPYSSVVDRQAKGFAVDVVREAYALVGITVKFDVLPYSRCMAATKAGTLVACFDAVPNAMIAKDYLWPDLPLFTTHMNVYALADSKDSGMVARKLEGRTVGVERGYEYGDEFDLNTKIIRKIVDKNDQGFKMLLARRIEFMAAEERIANALFIRFPTEFGGKFKLVGTVATPGLFIAFSKTAPDSVRLLKKFNEGYAILRNSPRYRAIEAKWF
ncbi:ABC transporter substrate-binding protein [Pseudoduganella ginsengisoli]|uniref:Transporter substrate-binding domain-containing protein n=1 Tax=Pseudoduganella ginsengisoli TaxID=1462440 RepID=A0A6L6Q6E6_9BURK|nr:transporter substrate-binding domain-containing protein [Pseudoduganella ginsengisoli]MTW05165.1 transporter substrate-binding domain-containing protein [Pseudoduganella ginsengisoli]